MSRNNSQSSSLLNNRLSLAEAAGPDALPPRHVRNGSSVGLSSAQQPQQPHSASGTLKRGTLSRQQSQRDNNAPQVRHHLMKLFLSFFLPGNAQFSIGQSKLRFLIFLSKNENLRKLYADLFFKRLD